LQEQEILPISGILRLWQSCTIAKHITGNRGRRLEIEKPKRQEGHHLLGTG